MGNLILAEEGGGKKGWIVKKKKKPTSGKKRSPSERGELDFVTIEKSGDARARKKEQQFSAEKDSLRLKGKIISGRKVRLLPGGKEGSNHHRHTSSD